MARRCIFCQLHIRPDSLIWTSADSQGSAVESCYAESASRCQQPLRNATRFCFFYSFLIIVFLNMTELPCITSYNFRSPRLQKGDRKFGAELFACYFFCFNNQRRAHDGTEVPEESSYIVVAVAREALANYRPPFLRAVLPYRLRSWQISSSTRFRRRRAGNWHFLVLFNLIR